MSVILAFIVAFDTAFRYHNVHGTVSPLTNRFFFVTEKRRLDFGRRRYGRLFLRITGLFVLAVYARDDRCRNCESNRSVGQLRRRSPRVYTILKTNTK